jgi:hypothetical protein
MKLFAYPLLFLAGVAVHSGYLALMGPLAPGVVVWWVPMVAPFYVAAVTLAIVQVISRPERRGIAFATAAYAIIVSLLGMLIAGGLYAGRHDRGQNHSDYVLFFVPLWVVGVLPSPILVFKAIIRRIWPNQSTDPTLASGTPGARHQPRLP